MTKRASEEWTALSESRELAFRVVATTRSPAERTCSTRFKPNPDDVPVTVESISE